MYTLFIGQVIKTIYPIKWLSDSANQSPSIIGLRAQLLSLFAKIKVLGVLSAHLPLVLDAGISVSVPPLSCAGFVCCHCTGRWAVLDNTHGKDSGVFR